MAWAVMVAKRQCVSFAAIIKQLGVVGEYYGDRRDLGLFISSPNRVYWHVDGWAIDLEPQASDSYWPEGGDPITRAFRRNLSRVGYRMSNVVVPALHKIGAIRQRKFLVGNDFYNNSAAQYYSHVGTLRYADLERND